MRRRRPFGAPVDVPAAPPRATAGAPRDPALEDVLQRVGRYVANYGEQASLIIAVEHYEQKYQNAPAGERSHRKLVAEFALFKNDRRDRVGGVPRRHFGRWQAPPLSPVSAAGAASRRHAGRPRVASSCRRERPLQHRSDATELQRADGRALLSGAGQPGAIYVRPAGHDDRQRRDGHGNRLPRNRQPDRDPDVGRPRRRVAGNDLGDSFRRHGSAYEVERQRIRRSAHQLGDRRHVRPRPAAQSLAAGEDDRAPRGARGPGASAQLGHRDSRRRHRDGDLRRLQALRDVDVNLGK